MRSRLLLLALIALAVTPVRAAQVNFIQASVNDVDSSTIGAVSSSQWLESGIKYETVLAPHTFGDYRFTHWTNSSYPGVNYRDHWTRALKIHAFTLLEKTTATAHYLPEAHDSDDDGIPDWFEIYQYYTLSNDATSDTDADGYTLLQEYTNGTEPHYRDPKFSDLTGMGSSGSYNYDDSSVMEVNLAGFSAYTLRSEPAGAVDQTAAVPDGTLVSTPNFTQSDFGYWMLDGVRQQDSWGRALRYIEFTVDGANREAVAYFFSGDTDADGLPDAYERFHYGTLSNDATSDTDADGYTLLQEYTNGTEPHYRDPHFSDLTGMGSSGSYNYADSSVIEVNLAGFSAYTLRSEPAGAVDQTAAVPDGTLVSTPNFTQSDFGYWMLDGVRQQDFWGRALRYIEFTVDGANREAVAYFFAGDTDADGLPDAYEQFHYGTLTNDATSDTDADGYTLLQEYTNGTEPHYRDPKFSDLTGMGSSGSYNYADSSLVVANLQPFERLSPIQIDGVLTHLFSTDPNLLDGQDLGDATSVAATDWDGDGDMDLFVAHETGLRIWQNIGTANNPNFSEVNTGFGGLSTYIGGGVSPRIAGGDWNGDGFGDLVIGGETGTLRFVASDGTWGSDSTGNDLATGSSSVLPALGDMDGDGDTDLLVLLTDGTVQFYANNGTAWPYTDPPSSGYLGATITSGTGITTGDINQDGRIDVLASDSEGRIWEFIQNADGSFFLQSKVWGGSYAGFASDLSIAAVDLEGDGDLDMLGGLGNGGVIALRNPSVGRPTGLFATPGAESILLTWNASSQSRISGYYLYRAGAQEGPFTNLAGEIIPLARYLDTAVTPATDYFYYTTAISRFFLPGNSEPRLVESLPSGLAAVAPGQVGLALRPAREAPGNYVSVNVSITSGMDIAGSGLQIQVSYDPALLTPAKQIDTGMESVLPTGLSENLIFSDDGLTASGNLTITGSGGSLEPGEGKLFTLQFQISPSAVGGQDTQLAVTSASMTSLLGGFVTVQVGDPVLVEFETTYIPGDVNGDGDLNKDDENLIKALMKPKSPDPTPEQLLAADLNGDGDITPQDLVLFKQLLNEQRN